MAAAADLTHGSLWQHLRRLAVPAGTGLFFNVLFNITDTFWAGQWSTDALAGLAFSFPLFFIVIACAVGLMQGCTGLLSRSHGRGKLREARYFFAQIMVLVVCFGVLLGCFGLVIMADLLKLLGSVGKQSQLAQEYLQWIYSFAPLMIGVFVLSGAFSAYGNTHTFRNALIASSLLNIVLDPMLMFGWFGLPKMGMNGIGLATVLAFWLQLSIMLPTLLRLPLMVGFHRRYLVPRWVGLKRCLAQSWPPAANMLGICGGFLINTYFIAQIDSLAVAAYGIALRIEQLVLLPSHGLSIALLSIAGQNFGAKFFDRLHGIYHATVKVGLLLAVIGAVLMVGGGRFLLGLFNEDMALIDYGYQYLLAATVLGPIYVYAHAANSLLQAVGFPKLIGVYGVLRLIVLPALLCPLFVWTFDMGTKGVWLSLVIANLLPTIALHLYARMLVGRVAPMPALAQ